MYIFNVITLLLTSIRRQGGAKWFNSNCCYTMTCVGLRFTHKSYVHVDFLVAYILKRSTDLKITPYHNMIYVIKSFKLNILQCKTNVLQLFYYFCYCFDKQSNTVVVSKTDYNYLSCKQTNFLLNLHFIYSLTYLGNFPILQILLHHHFQYDKQFIVFV